MRVSGGENLYSNQNDKDIDLSTMTNSNEILPQYRDQLEADIKELFIWVIGQNHGDDRNSQGKRTEFTISVQTMHAFSIALHSRKEHTPQQSRFGSI